MRFATSSEYSPTTTSSLSWLPIRWELPALFLVLLVGAWNDASALFNYSFAVGYDGYYYILQINELQNHGRFYFPTHTPFILYLLTAVSYLIGNPILAVKFCSVLLHAALSLGIFATIISVTRSRWLGVIGVALSITSGLHFYMVAEYVNQLGALAFLIWSVWCFIQLFQTHNKIWIAPSLICLLAAIFSHRSVLPIVLVVVVLAFLLVSMNSKLLARERRFVLIILILGLWLTPLILTLQPLVELPVWLKRELATTPRLPFVKAAIYDQIILLLVCPATLAIIFLRRRSQRDNIAIFVLGSVALWSLLITINPFLSTKMWMSVTWRLSILAYIQVAILVPGLIWLLAEFSRRATFLVAGFVLPLMICSALYVSPNGMEPAYLARRAKLLEALPSFRGQLGPGPIVISPHGEQFVLTWVLGVPSQQKWPTNNSYETTYWLLHDVNSELLASSMIVIATESENRHTVLIQEEDVKKLPMSNTEWRRIVVSNRHLLEHLIH